MYRINILLYEWKYTFFVHRLAGIIGKSLVLIIVTYRMTVIGEQTKSMLHSWPIVITYDITNS